MKFLDVIDNNCIKYKDRIAQIYNGVNLTYEELKLKSDILSNYIIDKCGSNNSPIIIYGHKEHEMIISFLACSKAGHAYIPIDTTFPEKRIKDIIKSSNAKLFINIGNIAIDDFQGDIIDLNDLKCIFEEYSNEVSNKEFKIKDEDVYYILYTSGSTGKPKGVQITYKCLQTFIEWFAPYCKTKNEESVFLNQVSYSFDVSVISVYIGLSLGKTLYVIDKEMISNFKLLFENFKKSNIAMWISTPSFAEMCLIDTHFNKELLPCIEKMFFAGEVLSKNLISNLWNRFGEVEIINGYGPTEATVLVTAVNVTKEVFDKYESIPIGYGMNNSDVYLVDDNGNKTKDGEKGELLVKGSNVSIGYYNNEEMTKKNFIKDDEDKLLIYKTGDLVYKEDEMFFYCGRKDFQIKLNGFRIELEDIENNLRKIDIVNNVVVLPIKKDDKISHLKAFVTLNEKTDEKPFKIASNIKNKLKKLLPEYMVPRNIKVLDSFPINANGKIDRKRLMEEKI